MKKLAHWNINRFDSKATDLEIFLNENNIDIMCLNKTKPSANTEFNITGYTLATRKDQSNRLGGGCAILVKNYIDCREVDVLEDDICVITMHLNKKLVCIISTYLDFAQEIQPAQDRLQALLRDFNHCIILGDFNAHHTRFDHNLRQNKRGKELAQICRDHNSQYLIHPISTQLTTNIRTKRTPPST